MTRNRERRGVGRGAAVAIASVLAVAAGCSTGDDDSSATADVVERSVAPAAEMPDEAGTDVTVAAAEEAAADTVAADSGGAEAEQAAAGGGGLPIPAAPSGEEPTPVYRAVIQTASMTVTVTDVRAAAAQVRAAAVAAGGFVAASEESGEDDGGATVTIKVPPGDFDRLLTELGALGEVEAQESGSEDVTDQVVDLDARIGAMQASVDRLIALMAQTDDIGEISALEAELTRRTADLEALEGQLRVLESQVSLSTITVVLLPPVVVDVPQEPIGVGTIDTAPSFLDGLRAGWGALVATARVVALVGGAVLPWMIPGSVLGGVALLVRQRVRRRAALVDRTLPPPTVA